MSSNDENRFEIEIERAIYYTMPYNNAVKSKKSGWDEFSQLLEEINYNLEIDNLSVD